MSRIVEHTTRPTRSDRMRNLLKLSASTLLLGVGACSSEPASRDEAGRAAPASENASASAEPAGAPAIAATQQNELTAAQRPAGKIIRLEGFGELKIGSPVPKASSWRERGAQINESCRTVTSPDYPGVYAIVEDGEVRRITVGQGSDVKLVEGVGVGTSAKAVQAAFPGFREEPHKYVASPAKYLTAPTPAPGAPGLRFEIGADNKVTLFHVGVEPTLEYVEGCA